jgi:branched-chain amino acid transport system substrate-binding protein
MKYGKSAIYVILLLVVALVVGACTTPTPTPPPPTTSSASPTPTPTPTPTMPPPPAAISFGHTGPLTGVLAGAEYICQTFYNLWTEQANAKGGLLLSKFDARVPVNWVLYNDMADTGKAATNVEKLITQDKVDIIYGSYGTFQGAAQEPLVNNLALENKVIYMAGNGTCVKWDTAQQFYDYYLQNKTYADANGKPWTNWEYTIWTEMPRAFHIEALVKVLQQVGVKSVVVWEIGTLYGAESSRFLEYLLPKAGIEILAKEQYPMEILDFTPLITKAKDLNPDAIIQFSYPGDGMKSIEDMISLDYNPKLFYNSLGVTSGDAYTKFGANLDGIMYQSTVFPKSPKSVGELGTGIELMNSYIEKYGIAPDTIDGPMAYATVEIMAALIERAGSTDKAAIYAEILKTKGNPIQTIMGPIYWERGPWPEAPGVVGQHIGTLATSLGEDTEIVSASFGELGGITRTTWTPSDWISKAPVYPKPAWKKP